MTVLEFWPDYGPGPLWTDAGKPVDLNSLDVDPDLVERVAAWHAAYEEDRVPIDGPGDSAWLYEGRQLLHEVRAALGREYRVIVTEPWWGARSGPDVDVIDTTCLPAPRQMRALAARRT